MSQRSLHDSELGDLFRDVVLVLGGVFALQRTDGETITRVATALKPVYRRARHRQRHPEPARLALAPHPALTELLRLIEECEVVR